MWYTIYNKERREVIKMKNININTKNPHGLARDLLIDEMLRKLEEEDAKKAS